jgi:kynurenine formamidase
MYDALQDFFFVAHLITVTPEKFENGDKVITLAQIKQFQAIFPIDALVIRTLPNHEEKMTKKYSNTNPPYFAPEVGLFLRENGVKHLLCDLPSVDKESDEGKLAMHKYFWDYPQNIRKNATITELIFVPNHIQDGLYLLNLQTPTLDADAVPSRPVLFLLTNN